MTILPKKKPPGGQKSSSEQEPEGGGGFQLSLSNNQASEELIFVAGNVSNEARWGVVRGGDSRPSSASPSHWSSSTSPTHWSNSGAGVSREEKRHSSPLHADDSLDSPPAPKRARQSHNRVRQNVGGRNKTYNMSAVPSSSRVPTPPPGEDETGYNSEDEYSHLGVNLSDEEWNEKDRRFERNMRRQGYLINKMGEDGACLFRAVADQLFGDQEMHRCVRAQCMDYLESNRDYFEQYVTEPFEEYVSRKRFYQVHGNHLEIQAMSELYNRPIHIYCYSAEPINIFQSVSRSNHEIAVPLRLSYQRGIHYNSIVDPNSTSIGVGLGLPGLKPGINKSDLVSVLSQNDNNLTEKQMLEDKIKFTDWEATNDAIEEHVARESYVHWLQDNDRKTKSPRSLGGSAAGQLSPRGTSGTSSPKPSSPRPLAATSPRPLGAPSPRPIGASSSRPLQATSPRPIGASSPHSLSSPRPRPVTSPRPQCSGHTSPKAGCSSQQDSHSPQPGSSSQPSCSRISEAGSSAVDYGLGPGFQIRETASYLNGLPPDLLGVDEFDGDSILRRVMLESQQEYLNSLKRQAQQDKTDGK